ncbi:MAG: hypothetical protein HYX92_11585 [Chloroflexi bacterium]|nr:hypothetical protein [Chloroflexota bacterium]
MSDVVLKLSKEASDKLGQYAREGGLKTEEIASLILEEFVAGKGKVYTGEWKEGPGVRVLPDWPKFSSRVVKIEKK